MLGDDASLDVRGTAGRVVDDHRDGLALVELGKRGVANGAERKRGQPGDDQRSSDHEFLPVRFVLCRVCLSAPVMSSRAGARSRISEPPAMVSALRRGHASLSPAAMCDYFFAAGLARWSVSMVPSLNGSYVGL